MDLDILINILPNVLINIIKEYSKETFVYLSINKVIEIDHKEFKFKVIQKISMHIKDYEILLRFMNGEFDEVFNIGRIYDECCIMLNLNTPVSKLDMVNTIDLFAIIEECIITGLFGSDFEYQPFWLNDELDKLRLFYLYVELYDIIANKSLKNSTDKYMVWLSNIDFTGPNSILARIQLADLIPHDANDILNKMKRFVLPQYVKRENYDIESIDGPGYYP